MSMVIVSLACASPYAWLEADPKDTIQSRVDPPPGFERVSAPADGFAAWLRGLPVKPGKPDVELYDGSPKGNQEAHHLVVDIDVGERDLQQCADVVMRLRAEYLRWQERHEDICFRFTSGDALPWSRWQRGERPRVRGKEVSWRKRAKSSADRETFRLYLDEVFLWAGSASLSLELRPVANVADVQIGDVYIQGGFPGHAVLVVDVATNNNGERVFLVAQGYTPAQDVHVLTHTDSDISPWYRAGRVGKLETPEWTFERTDLRRFSERGCP